MKQNFCAVVGEVTKPAGVGLDELDGAVETFGARIADFVLTEVEQTRLMTPEHPDYLFDWLQPTAHGVARPRIEETFGCPFVAVAPELGEVLLDCPSSTGLEVELIQGPKGDRFSAASIGIFLEPRPLAAEQWRRARLRQPAVLKLTHCVYRLAEVLGDVKLVMHGVKTSS